MFQVGEKARKVLARQILEGRKRDKQKEREIDIGSERKRYWEIEVEIHRLRL